MTAVITVNYYSIDVGILYNIIISFGATAVIWQGDSKIILSNRDIVVNKLQIYK